MGDMAVSDVVLRARTDLSVFAEYCFGFVNTWFHEEWYDTISNVDIKSGLIIAPRNSAKSTCWAKVAVLWLLGTNPDLRIVIVSRTSALAKTDMRFIRLNIESNDKVAEVFPYQKLGNRVYGLKQSAPWGEDALTVVNNRHDGVPSIIARGLGGSITGFRADVIIVDDLIDQNNVMTESQRNKIDEFWDTVVTPTLEPNGRIFLIGCLTGDSRVTMADGSFKNIIDCRVGDTVISYDSIETVEAMIPQGEADVYELRTKNHTIQATANHPFLCDRDGEKKFVKLEDLVVGDYLICNHRKIGGIEKEGFDEETAWILGFMFGDGWITHNPNKLGSKRWVVCFAKSVQSWKNEKALKYFKERFNANPHETDFGYYRMNNAKLGRFLESIGFKGKAKTKRVPKYVFTLNDYLRKSFLDGFSAADGTVGKNGLTSIELANEQLILDLKHLTTSLGYRVSNVYYRKRLSQPPHSPKPIESESWHISYGHMYRPEKFRRVYVKSIKHVGKKEVYDLTISNTHNFIANGLVVHNTRYHAKDFYARMLEDLMYKDSTFMFPALELDDHGDYKLGEDGNPISYWPARWSVEALLEMKERMGSLAFNSQYQCDPSGYAGQLFDPDVINFYNPKMLTSIWGNLDFVQSIDPNITADPESDNTAIVTAAVDRRRGNVYILDIFAKPLAFVDQVQTMKKYATKTIWSVGGYTYEAEARISKVGVEAVAYQRSLQQTGYLMGLPVVEIKQGNRNKEIRILGMYPHIENGRVLFPNPYGDNKIPWWDEFLLEYCTFPKGRRDDRLDSLEILVTMVSGSFGVSGIPWGPGGNMRVNREFRVPGRRIN